MGSEREAARVNRNGTPITHADPDHADPRSRALPKYGLYDGRHPTRDIGGNEGIDNGGGTCSAQGGPGCFLNDAQRATLLRELDGRINNAQLQYSLALTDLHVEKLIDSDSELSPMLNVMLSVVFSNATMLAGAAVKVLKKLGEPKRALAGIKIKAEAGGIFGNVSEKECEHLVGGAMETAKGAINPSIVGEANPDAKDAKAEKLGYIDVLRNNSVMMFQHLREDPSATANDAQLLALFVAFDGTKHTLTRYRTELDEHIKRYFASHASKIGRTNPDSNKTRETRVAWLRSDQSAPKLIYVSRDFGTMELHLAGQPPLANTEAPMLGLDEGSTQDNGQGGTRTFKPPALSKEDGFLGYVEPEFQEIAVKKQEETWLQAPVTFVYDYSTVPPKLVKES